MSELSICGENQKARRIDVEPPDRNPAPAPEAGQTVKNRSTSLRVIARADLTYGLVVKQYPRARWRARRKGDGPTIHRNPAFCCNSLPDLGRPAIDLYPPLAHPTLDLTAGSQARPGECFLYPFSQIPCLAQPWSQMRRLDPGFERFRCLSRH